MTELHVDGRLLKGIRVLSPNIDSMDGSGYDESVGCMQSLSVDHRAI